MARRRTHTILSKRRGAVLLEFVLMFPMFVYLIMFSFDIGRAVVTYGALTDGAYVAARSNAQIGLADPDVAIQAFNASAGSVPGIGCAGGPSAEPATVCSDTKAEGASAPQLTVGVRDNGSSPVVGPCTTGWSFVEVSVSKQFEPLSPGVGAVIGIVDEADGGAVTINAKAQVLCEVVR